MDQDKRQPSRDAEQPKARPAESDKSRVGRKTAENSARDYDQRIGDPDIPVEQFTDDVEYVDNRGPLGTGD